MRGGGLPRARLAIDQIGDKSVNSRTGLPCIRGDTLLYAAFFILIRLLFHQLKEERNEV